MSSKSGKGRLRCCLSCYLVQSQGDFKRNGCPNCEEFLDMKGNTDRIEETTTLYFDGAIAIIKPEESWVAKYQRSDKMVPGIYAARTNFTLSAEDAEIAQANGRFIRRPEED